MKYNYTSTWMNPKMILHKRNVTLKYLQHDSIYYKVLKQAQHYIEELRHIWWKQIKNKGMISIKIQGGDYFRWEGNAIREGYERGFWTIVNFYYR